MQPTPQAVSLSLKSFYFGGGSIAILILEVAALVYGVSDGSFMFVAPLLISPIVGITGIVFGILAIKRKSQPRAWAIAGVICGGLCVLLFIAFFVFALALTWALGGVS